MDVGHGKIKLDKEKLQPGQKLDGVGTIYNRPFTKELQHFVQK